MVRTITIDELRERAGELFADPASVHQPVVLEKDGHPLGALISMTELEAYERYRQERWEQAWAAIDEIHERNADLDPDEVYRIVTETVEEVRQEMYEERLRANHGRD